MNDLTWLDEIMLRLSNSNITYPEAKQAITTKVEQLVVEAKLETLRSCYVDQGEIYVRFKGGFAEQYDRIKQLQATHNTNMEGKK